jgi:RNA-directed DNA polymerase
VKIYKNVFEKIISTENLFLAWDKFKKGKRQKLDVQKFEFNLEENLFKLQRELKSQTYIHGPYKSFYIQDPKLRNIHKAKVKDRILHHAVFNILSPIFETAFIPHSFSCRVGKGTHKGVNQLASFLRKVSKNNRRACFVLKCDIKKFFYTIDHQILISIIKKRIKDKKVLLIIEEVIESFISGYSTLFERKGLPLGNLTSQLFANIYLNELDQFIKHKLREKYYLRYTDDFAIIGEDEFQLRRTINPINNFLKNRLKLTIHPKKIIIRKYYQGIDFLGYICFPHYRLLRSKTKKRMF